MARYEASAMEITRENPAKSILEVLQDETLQLLIREDAAFALKELCTSDKKNCQILLDIKGQTYLEGLLKRPIGQVSLKMLTMAVDILTLLGGYPEMRKLLIDMELIDSLSTLFEVSSFAIRL